MGYRRYTKYSSSIREVLWKSCFEITQSDVGPAKKIKLREDVCDEMKDVKELKPNYNIRDWAPDCKKMRKVITLTEAKL